MPTNPTWDDVVDKPTWDDVIDKPEAFEKSPPNLGGQLAGLPPAKQDTFGQLYETYSTGPATAQLPESFIDPTAGMPTTDQFREHYWKADRAKALANRPTKADLYEQQQAIATKPSWRTVPNKTGGFDFAKQPGDTPGSFSVIDQYLSAFDPVKSFAKGAWEQTGNVLGAVGASFADAPPTWDLDTFANQDQQKEAKEWMAERASMSPSEKRAQQERNPINIAGRAMFESSEESFNVIKPDSFGSEVGNAIGGFFPALPTGALAPFVFALQGMGASLRDSYHDNLSNGMSEDEAATSANRKALAEGAFQGLFMKFFPHQARKLGDAGIDALFGKVLNDKSVKRFLAGRVAQAGEGAAFGVGSAVGSNIIQGRDPETGLLESGGAMAAIQAALRRGATKGEIKSHNEHIGRMVAEKNRILKAHDEDLVRPEHKDELTDQLTVEQRKAYFADLPDGSLSKPDGRGNIIIDQRQLANALAEMPTDAAKSQLIKSLVTEEAVHIASKKENGLKFFNMASKAEQVLAMKQYWGETTDSNIGYKDRLAEASKDPENLETFKANMGLEMMRSKLQQLQKMTPTQIAMEHGGRQTSIAHLLSMENMIWKMRSAYSKVRYAENAPIDQQRRILEETAAKLAKAREIVIEKLPEKIQPDEPVRKSEPEPAGNVPIPTTLKIEAARARLAELKAKQAQAAQGQQAVAGMTLPVDVAAQNEASAKMDEPPVAAAQPPPKPAPQEGINPKWKLDASDYNVGRKIDPDNEPFSNKPSTWKKVTEQKIESMSPEEILKWGNHTTGIAYGLTLDRSKIPHLEEQYAKAGSDMAKAFAGTFDEAAHQIAFGKYGYYGGALAGVTRGQHKAAAGNFEIFKRDHPEQVAEADGQPATYKKGMSQKQFLAEKERQLKAAFLAAKGEEIPAHLASAGMPKNVGGEKQAVPEELRIGSGFKRLDMRDVHEAAVDELGRDITEKASSREYELKPGKRGDVPETYTDLEGNPHYEKRVKVDVKYDRPNFDRFATSMNEAATNLSNEELVAIWTDKVWSRLIQATPERLSQLRNALGLEGRFGRRSLGEDPLGKSEIAPHSEPQNLDITKAAERRRAVLEKRIDKLEELSKKKLAEANEWADSVSDEDLAKYKDELFGPPGKGQTLRKQASDLRYQVQMLRYALSKASNETLAKAYTKGLRQPTQQPLGSLTAQTKAMAGERSRKLLEEAKTASPERTKEIDAELQRLAQMVKRAERLSESSGPDTPAERTGEAGTAMAGYRNKVIRAIAHQLIGEAYRSAKEKADVNRRSVDSEDLDFTNKKSKAGVYYEITGGDLEMQKDDVQIPYRLKTVLRDQARGKNTDLESASRRLLVVEAPDGTVHLLSVYNDGGVFRVTDPNFTGDHKPYRELSGSFMAKYKPFASLLLKDPVKGLNHIFDNRAKFMDEMGQEAKDRSEVGDEMQHDFLAASNQQIEGTHGIEGEMGSFQGPKKGMIDYEPRDPALQSGKPLARNEAFAVSRYKNRMDVLSRLGELAQKVESKEKLTPKDIVEISGFRKIANAIEKSSKRNPELTSDPIGDFVELSGLVASTIANSHGFGNPVKTLLRSYGQKKTGTFAPERQKSELTMRGDIRPPTSQKEFAGPFQRAEAPGAEIGVKNPKAYIPENVTSRETVDQRSRRLGKTAEITKRLFSRTGKVLPFEKAAERAGMAPEDIKTQQEIGYKKPEQNEGDRVIAIKRFQNKWENEHDSKISFKNAEKKYDVTDAPMAWKKKGKPDYEYMPTDSEKLHGIVKQGVNYLKNEAQDSKFPAKAEELINYFKKLSDHASTLVRGEPEIRKLRLEHTQNTVAKAIKDIQEQVDKHELEVWDHLTNTHAPFDAKTVDRDTLEKYIDKTQKYLGELYEEHTRGLENPDDIKRFEKEAKEIKESLKRAQAAWADRFTEKENSPFDSGDQQSFAAAHKKGLSQEELPDHDPMKFGWIGMPTDNKTTAKQIRDAFKLVDGIKDPEQALIKSIQILEYLRVLSGSLESEMVDVRRITSKEIFETADLANEVQGKILQIEKKIVELEDRDLDLAPRLPEQQFGFIDMFKNMENQREFREQLSGGEEQSFAAAHKKGLPQEELDAYKDVRDKILSRIANEESKHLDKTPNLRVRHRLGLQIDTKMPC